MKYLIKLFPEITIKSRSVRLNTIRCLNTSIRNVLSEHPQVRVVSKWDAIEVEPGTELPAETLRAIEEALSRVPGIHEILTVEESRFESFAQTAQLLLPIWLPCIAHRRFRVRVKRRGKHEFRSEELERYLGAALLEGADSARVDLRHPDVTVSLELKDDRLLLVTERRPGLGGFPLGSQGEALALISGGFDSPVAAYRLIRRGIKVHYLFFNLGGPAHEAAVREVTHHLWQRYSASHRVRFTCVPFEDVVNEILKTVPDGMMGVVLKRMMLRAANRVATRARLPALVTGDAIGQVSSQSLANLRFMDAVSDLPVLRPLIASDKLEIITEARRIGTASFAEVLPEYCGVISRRPNIRPKPQQITAAEATFNFEVLERAIDAASTLRSDRLMENAPVLAEVTTIDSPQALARAHDCSVIDIRPAEERDAAPLDVAETELLEIPFYELQQRARELPDDRLYLLYCQQGVMSRMQALHLIDQGFTHFGVYRQK